MNHTKTIAFILVLLPVLNFVIPHVIKLIWKKQFLRQISRTDKIYLTFDDGPDPHNTKEILDLLKVYNIKATFFVIGENARINKGLIERMIIDGHTVSIHGNNHLHPWKVLPWRAMADIMQCRKLLKEYGIRSNYIRPPFGKLNFFTMLYFLFSRLIFVHWNIDSLDYKCSDPKLLGEYLNKRIGKGKIILLHDGRRKGTSPGKITIKGLEIYFNNSKFDPCLFSSLSLLN